MLMPSTVRPTTSKARRIISGTRSKGGPPARCPKRSIGALDARCHDIELADQCLFEKGRLNQPALALPASAIRCEQAVTEQDAQALVTHTFDVVAGMRLQDVADVVRLDQKEQRLVAHAEAHEVWRCQRRLVKQLQRIPAIAGEMTEEERAGRTRSLGGGRWHESRL